MQSAPPSVPTVLLLYFTSFVLFVTFVSIYRNYFATVNEHGDNPQYMAIASSISDWSFQDLKASLPYSHAKHFWGFPYVIAAVSLLTGASDRTALLLTSVGTSFAAIALACRLWGGWVASFFAVISITWIEISFLGSAEPLFLFLLFGAFWAARRQNWFLAALLASLSTVVRPVGMFALIAIGLTLLHRREFKRLALATLTGLTVGGLYIVPLAASMGDAFVNVRRYQQEDWGNGLLIGWPFQAIIEAASLSFHAIITAASLSQFNWHNLLLNYGWLILTLLATIAMITTSRFRQFARNHPVEILFATGYLAFLYTYNSHHVLVDFARLMLPVLPFVLIALDQWIPKNKLLLSSVGFVSPLLAAATVIGMRNVIGLIPSP
jgi:Gpi18-like mannosyltransferase